MAVPPPLYPTQWSTVQPAQPFDPEKATAALRQAMKGLGTNEDEVIRTLTSHCNAQRQEIEKTFKRMYGRDLRKDLKSELSGNFETVALALLDHPRIFDAKELHDAIQGPGTDEDAIIEILTTRSKTELAEIKSLYKSLFKEDLQKDIQGDTSGDLKKLLISLLNGSREDRQNPDLELARKEAQDLFKAGEKRAGTDEETFIRVFCLRSFPQLQATFCQYKAIAGKDIDKTLVSETRGDLEIGLRAVALYARNPAKYFAKRLHKVMARPGTDDRGLIRTVVSRSEIDMVLIKQEFQRKYKKTLASYIKGDTSGDYKKILVAIVKDP